MAGEMSGPACQAALDADLAVLRSRVPEWAGLGIAKKREMLGWLHKPVGGVAAKWVRLGTKDPRS